RTPRTFSINLLKASKSCNEPLPFLIRPFANWGLTWAQAFGNAISFLVVSERPAKNRPPGVSSIEEGPKIWRDVRDRVENLFRPVEVLLAASKRPIDRWTVGDVSQIGDLVSYFHKPRLMAQVGCVVHLQSLPVLLRQAFVICYFRNDR